MTFDTFRMTKPTSEAFDAATKLVMNELGVPWVVMYGTTGNGKTHLAKAAANEAINRGIETRYWYVPSLLAAMRKGMKPEQFHGAWPVEALVDDCCSCTFLVFDDWGAEHTTDWVDSQLEMILNRRYEDKKMTLITTNKDLTKVVSRAVLSRFKDTSVCKLVHNAGTDQRPKMGAK